MDFWLDKCTKATFCSGKLFEKTNLKLNLDIIIKELEQKDVYKYLRVNGGHDIQHISMKKKI